MLPARHAVPALVFALLSALFALLVACGGGGGATETASAPARRPTYAESDEAAGAGEEAGGGWRWQGKRDGCFFRYQNHCFDKLENACRAARCPESRCAHDSSAPAVVTCRK